MPKIKDVAARAGVSPSTVSRVLNNLKWVRPDTAEKVWRAVNELNYAPNAIAKGLRERQTGMIGAAISNPYTSLYANLFFFDVVRGIGDEVERNDRSLVLATIQGQSDEPLPKMVTTQLIEGLIIGGVPLASRFIGELLRTEIPLVIIGRHGPSFDVSRVVIDNLAGAKQATQFLLDRGLRRIGFVGGSKNFYAYRERQNGFEVAFEEANLPVPKYLIAEMPHFRREDGAKAVDDLLKTEPRLEGLIVTQSDMTMGVLDYLHEQKIEIPKQLCVVGDGPTLGTMIYRNHIAFTQTDTQSVGRLAARMLLDILEGRQSLPTRMTVGRQLIIPPSWT